MSEFYREDNARGTEGDMEKGEVAHPAGSNPENPPNVLPVEKLLSDIRALKKLTAPKEPPRVRLRAREVLQALYIPNNASGAGFGPVVIGTKGIMYKSGT